MCLPNFIDHLHKRNREIFYFKNHAENEAGRLVSDIFLFFQKALYKVKASGFHVGFTIFR